MLKLSLGPILFYWSRDEVYRFYEEMLNSCVDIIYLGEVVCGKRHELRTGEWLDLARELSDKTDKQIILSTLALSESNADLNIVRKLVDNHGVLIEANDMSAVNLAIDGRLPFVCGPMLNIYNGRTLQLMADNGAVRWVMPVDLNRESLDFMLSELSTPLSTEVFAYGKLPLALSARCFTARNLDLTKDNCQYSCINYPDGMDLLSQEDEQLFTINGIQTLSGKTSDLVDQLPVMDKMGVDIVRISPQYQNMSEVLARFDQARNGVYTPSLIASDAVNGYWFGEPGMMQTSADLDI